MADHVIACVVCSKNFIYTDGEQAFMEGLKSSGQIKEIVVPKRCRDCRTPMAKKKAIKKLVPEPAVLIHQPAAAVPTFLPPTTSVPPSAAVPVVTEVKVEYQIPPFNLPISEGNKPDGELRCVLVAGDFEKLVCRQEVHFRQGNKKITLILADIGPQAMKDAMKKAVLSWWGS